MAVDATGVQAWALPHACDGGAPGAVVAMRTVTDGDGAAGTAVRVQQVATFPDVEAAVAEAGRLTGAMDRCAAGGGADPEHQQQVGPVAVGAQGYAVALRYSTDDPASPGAAAAALTRRGNALTLLASTGGDVALDRSRRAVTARAQDAWERLCLYDRTAGCPAG